MAEQVSIRGRVRSYGGSAVHMVKISIYRGAELLAHTYTDEAGNYSIPDLPAGDTVAVRFDTHPTLTNSPDWHPSVIANVDASGDILLDRLVLKVGTTAGVAADIDALAGYQFTAMWTAARVDSGSEHYSKEAAARLTQMKFTTDLLRQIQGMLIAHFESA